MVTEKKVWAKTSLTFASCYCFWKHSFTPLQKFLWKADVTHFLFQFCQRLMATVEVIILTGKESYLSLDYSKKKKKSTEIQYLPLCAQNWIPLLWDPHVDEHYCVHEVVNKNFPCVLLYSLQSTSQCY